MEKQLDLKMENIKEFLSSERRNLWLYWDDSEVYLKKVLKLISGVPVICLCVSNVRVKEAYRCKGVFTKLMDTV